MRGAKASQMVMDVMMDLVRVLLQKLRTTLPVFMR